MTTGNLITNPQVGLLFLDFESGDALQLCGRATLEWDPQRTVDDAPLRTVVALEKVTTITKCVC
jgi:hypothetical protein